MCSGKKTSYDWDGQALSTEPSDLPQIKNHISQISSTVNKYADCVYILQGTLTGNTGEMNHSNYGDINQIRQIIEALDQNISSDIFLAVRTPGQLRGILRTRTPLSSTDAGNGSLQARLSLFNDGMLGSVYDLGTYDAWDSLFSLILTIPRRYSISERSESSAAALLKNRRPSVSA